jgi:hypothetical protein
MTIPPNVSPGQAAAPARAIVSEPLSPLELRLHEDLQWARHSTEAQQHPGKLLIVRDKRVIAIGQDHQALMAQAVAQEKCPWWEFAVYLVPPMEEFREVPK